MKAGRPTCIRGCHSIWNPVVGGERESRNAADRYHSNHTACSLLKNFRVFHIRVHVQAGRTKIFEHQKFPD